MADENKLQNGHPARVWCDGCYDLFHFGHANSLRQAKDLGDYLLVGVHTDQEICKYKGPPVFTFEERCRLVKAVKWVDEVVPDVPYITYLEQLQALDCDFCCHGDDLTTTSEGEDTYGAIKAAGKYREVQRTKGISTTGLVERILEKFGEKSKCAPSPWTGSRGLPLAAGRVAQFSTGRSPRPGEVVVYVSGDFDLFHVGHLELLEKARELGDYLLVGLHSDRAVREAKGGSYPILSMHERMLTLLACRYVSDVVMDVPMEVTKELMEGFEVDVVVGEECHANEASGYADPYEYPKSVGKFVVVNGGSDVTTEAIIERIVGNKDAYVERNERKEQKELKLFREIERAKCQESA